MPKLTVQVRTSDDLRNLLAQGESPAWVIADDRIQEITHVQVIVSSIQPERRLTVAEFIRHRTAQKPSCSSKLTWPWRYLERKTASSI
jgi:hypothetical protein